MWRFLRDGLFSLSGLLLLVSFCLPARSTTLSEEASGSVALVKDRRGRVVAMVDSGRVQASLAPEFLAEAGLEPGLDREGMRLSLDLGWQNRARKLLANRLRNLGLPASAALVAIDARSREVWCLASLDSEDLGLPSGGATFPAAGRVDRPSGVESPWRLQLEPLAGVGGGSLLDWALELAWLVEQGQTGPLHYVLRANMAATVGPAAVLNGVLSLAMTRRDLRGLVLTGAALSSADGVDAWMVAAHQNVVVGVWFGLNQGELESGRLSQASEAVWQDFVEEWLRSGPASS